MKYFKEAKRALKEVFFEEWMNEEDWEEFETLLFKQTGIDYELLSRDIEQGVENGHSVDFQISMLKKVFELHKNQTKSVDFEDEQGNVHTAFLP